MSRSLLLRQRITPNYCISIPFHLSHWSFPLLFYHVRALCGTMLLSGTTRDIAIYTGGCREACQSNWWSFPYIMLCEHWQLAQWQINWGCPYKQCGNSCFSCSAVRVLQSQLLFVILLIMFINQTTLNPEILATRLFIRKISYFYFKCLVSLYLLYRKEKWREISYF